MTNERIVLDGQELDVQSQALIARAAAMSPGPLRTNTLAVNREVIRLSMMNRPPCPVADVTDRTIAGPGGEMSIRVYRPDGLPSHAPATVFFHGGGWVRGDLDTHHFMCGTIAQRAACVVVAVDYRRAPEHSYPAAIDDAIVAFQHVVANASAFGIDASSVAVAGDSSGANLAAAVCLHARDTHTAMPCFQLLLYPITDLARESASYALFPEGFALTRDGMRWFIEQYTPDAARRTEVLASPLLAPHLSGLPPAHVIVAGFDVLRDEGLAYAERLQAAGVPTTCEKFSSTYHGFFAIPGLDVSDRAVESACAALRAGLSK